MFLRLFIQFDRILLSSFVFGISCDLNINILFTDGPEVVIADQCLHFRSYGSFGRIFLEYRFSYFHSNYYQVFII